MIDIYPPNDPPSDGRDALRPTFWSFAVVEERLVEAMRHWWRSPDGDARYGLGGRISSIWRQAFIDKVALIEQLDLKTEEPRAPPLSRADIARMNEASEWLAFVDPRDRQIVVAALRCLASGQDRVPWLKLKQRLGVRFGADGLRKRYSRSITAVANALNKGGNPPA